jgi:hypothetical protein
MSIKDLFVKKPTKILTSKKIEDLEFEVESERNILQTFEDKERFVPNVDFGVPAAFARYGSAEEYYKNSIERIHDEYPYDGTFAEKKKFLNESTYLDLYVLDYKYPKTNGYIVLASDSWNGGDGESAASTDGEYGVPAASRLEYIRISGSMALGGDKTDITGESLIKAFNEDGEKKPGDFANIYNADIYDQAGVLASGRKGTRQSNLLFDFENDGVTIEFWLKKPKFMPDLTKKEVIFDLWNKEGPEEDTYGRITLEVTGSEDGTSPFVLTCRSGAYNDGHTGGFSNVSIAPTTLTTGNVADDSWHHYAVSIYNSGTYVAPGAEASNSDGVVVKFYRDGDLLNTVVTGTMIGRVTGSLVANIGALISPVSASTPVANEGWGKLSGSLDEFRYWKAKRDSKEIGRNWWSQVGAGVNSDIANAELGVYFKFNEGIVGDSQYDSVVLDYSGRMANGKWIGYPGSAARSVNSAIVESGYAEAEDKDPIIYSVHPDVSSMKTELMSSGSEHDVFNGSQLLNFFPTFMVEEDENSSVGASNLKNLTNAISSYLDTLHLQIEALPRIQDATYLSASYKPHPFMDRVLEGKGFVAPELFTDAELINQILSRDEDRDFDILLHDVKNLIYKNVYNNLVYIYKSKGTIKSFRNLIRGFGVDDELVKINLYGNNVTHLIRNNFRSTAVNKNYVDFSDPTRFNASVIQHSGTYAPEAGGPLSDVSDFVVSGAGGTYASLPATAECEAIFPRLPQLTDNPEAHYAVPFLSASLFGWHTPSGADWAAASDDYGVEIYAVRTSTTSKDAYFLIRSRAGYGASSATAITTTDLTSSVYKDVYDNEKWNFSVSFKHAKEDAGFDVVSGSTDTQNAVELEFYGVNMIQDVVVNEFLLTASSLNHKYLSNDRRYYLGAHRENFNSTLQTSTYSRISSLRHWQSYLGTGSIRAHAMDPDNYGARNPFSKSAHFTDVELGGLTGSVHVPEIATLALNWDYHRVTGSDDSGEFFVEDAASGSVAFKNEGRYGAVAGASALNNIITTRYLGMGINSPANDSDAVTKQYVTAAKQLLPESLSSDDMISVLDFDDETFTRETRPIDYFFAFEKSMYQTVSEEIIKMFATIVEFNNLIGEPVNKYRDNYKAMEKLRNLFFERIGNTPNLDQYVSYYKWIDDALSEMIRELVPASANTSDGLRNMVESHVLERSKYRHKFPTLEIKDPVNQNLQNNPYDPQAGQQPEAGVTSEGVELIPWDDAHAPVVKNVGSKKGWWRLRAERNATHDAAGWRVSDASASDAESNVEDLRKINNRRTKFIRGANVGSASDQKYKSQFYHLEQNSSLVRISAFTDGSPVELKKHRESNFNLRNFTGGSNSGVGKKKDFVFNSINFGTTEGLSFNNINEDSKELRLREADFDTEKVRKNYDLNSTDGGKGDRFSPFSLITTTVSEGYNNTLTTNLGTGADIANYHDDNYGPTFETPMQGPFTEKLVGGRQHRHAEINRYDTAKQGTNNLDGKKDRTEAWKLTHPSTGEIKLVYQDVNKPRGIFMREEYAKRPVNIRNYRTRDSLDSSTNATMPVTSIGNYDKDYEVISLANRSASKRAFIKQGGFDDNSVISTIIADTQDVTKPTYTISGGVGRTEFAFVQRFSAPGGPETAGDSQGGPGLDFINGEMSPYNSLNYRNLTVRLPLRTMLSSSSGKFGFANGVDPTSADYSGNASFHRTNPNPSYRVKPTSTGVTDPDTETNKVSDNFYFTRAIPQSDLQYSWVTASAVTYEGFGVLTNRRLPISYLSKTGIYSSSTGYDTSLLVVSASDAGSYISGGDRVWAGDKSDDSAFDNTQFVFTDFIGLNYNIVEPINSGTLLQGNTAGSSLETYLNGLGSAADGNFIQTNNSTPSVLNSILLNRNGAYGYPSWKQVRAGSHPVNRLLRKNAKIAVNTFPGVKRFIDQKGKTPVVYFDRFGPTNVYQEPAITSRYKPIVQVLGVRAEVGDTEKGKTRTILKPVPFKSSYGNNKVSFSNPDLDETHGNTINIPQPYDKLKRLYLSDKINRESSPVDSFIELRYAETVYPAEQNAYLDKIRRRISFSNNFWRDNRETRNTSRTSFTSNLTSSAWSLDAASDFVSKVTGSSAGILLNNVSQIHWGTKNALIAAPYYSRLHMSPSTASVRSITGPRGYTGSFGEDPAHLTTNEVMGDIGIGGGHALWEAGTQAGFINGDNVFVSDPRNPAYDSYDDYALELRGKNKDMSVIPEFRISDHMDYYVREQQGNFLSKNSKLFSIFGVPSGSDNGPANSSETDFYKVYSNSDFMKHFDVIREEHENLVEPSEIKLSCKALVKFMPYNGFYPSERTVDLATQFSRSYGPHIQYAGSDATDYPNVKFRNILTPFFAPGIVYNSIKSGIACDYPVYTRGATAFAKVDVNPNGPDAAATNYYLLGTSSTGLNGYTRIPFEDVVKPTFLKGLKILDNEPHPSSSIDVTASWGGGGDRLYELMSNNYHAAVPDFFLEQNSFTTLTSVPESQFESFESGNYYGMRVRVRKSYHSPRPLANRAKYPFPNDQFSDNVDYDTFESFTMYSRPSAFGPPVAGRNTLNPSAGATSENFLGIMDSLNGVNPAFTPPYYDGECWFDIVFQAYKDKHTLREIFQTASTFSLRFDPESIPTGDAEKPYGEVNINTFSMQLSSSFNLFGIAPIRSVEYGADGAPETIKDDFGSDNNVWVIQPKFETPMLNFNDQGAHAVTASNDTLTLPTDVSASAMTPNGMWHQFGTIPDSNEKGVFIEVSDIEEEWLSNRLSDGTDFTNGTFAGIGENVYNNGNVKSLLDKVKFKKKSKRLGELAKYKTVREAIVAIPFVERSGKRKFFEIPEPQFKAALGLVDSSALEPSSKPGKSIVSMIEKMKNYVMPPPMDFVTYPEKVKPFAMYIFEFEHTFDQNDLSYMWQNLLPNSGLQMKEAEASITHKLLINELMGASATTNGKAIQPKLQWMVFKIKQKAPTNYFDKVVSNSKVADRRFDFAFDVEDRSEIPEFSYNWPYDFFSLVEFAKLDAEVKLSKDDSELSVSSESSLLSKSVAPDKLKSTKSKVETGE